MINKILIANRGEIAIQIIKKCQKMKIKTVAIYSNIDRNSLHVALADESVCIGPADSQLSYMNMDSIIEIAKLLKVDAIHPGYGFLAESSVFAKKCKDNGFIFIGSNVDNIELLGNKEKAKIIMKKEKIPVIEGNEKKIETLENAILECNKIGYPVILKASYGGGGKGIKVIENEEELIKRYNITKTEVERSFDKGDIYIEKYIQNARHIEFQMIADQHNNIDCIGIRDCTIQKNNQKIIEETLNEQFNNEKIKVLIGKIKMVLKKMSFYGIGTMEFLKDENDNFYFLEMNVRLQVEYKITELTSGVDIIKKQIEIADGKEINIETNLNNKYCIEVRINMEKNLKKSQNKIDRIILPNINNVYYDTYIYEGYEIPIIYDSMLCKVQVLSNNRKNGLGLMKEVLNNIVINGIETNLNSIIEIFNNDKFNENTHNTNLLK